MRPVFLSLCSDKSSAINCGWSVHHNFNFSRRDCRSSAGDVGGKLQSSRSDEDVGGGTSSMVTVVGKFAEIDWS